MFNSENNEIKEMVEILLKKELENKINKGATDTTELNNGQTIINIDLGLSSYALLYFFLKHKHTTDVQTNIPTDSDQKNSILDEKKIKKMIEDVNVLKEKNNRIYLEILESLA